MGLNQSKGNMYPFVTHTWNAIKGRCPHDCSYCYMKRFPQKPVRLDLKEFNTDLGTKNFIFVGSSCDMFADAIPDEWIIKTIEHCYRFKNTYLFQSKNPARFENYKHGWTRQKAILGTTIETNRYYSEMGGTPTPLRRAISMARLANTQRTMLTIEPIMDFDMEALLQLVLMCQPEWVNIGADSMLTRLPEPDAGKINELIAEIKDAGIEVKLKSNIHRLL